ncbi:MAG TPA: CBS domain-containing protein, partial [Saprospiraceae bacterium]|nr:CBS domain-containing protein [Saprospiraceae bacterium]
FSTARTENSMVQLDAVLQRYKAKDLVRPQFTRLLVTDWMQTPITLLKEGLERHFLVFDIQERLIGTLDEPDIVAALKKRDLSSDIGAYAREPVEVVHPEESLKYVYYVLMQRRQGILAVADENGLIGVIDQEGLRHFLRLL